MSKKCKYYYKQICIDKESKEEFTLERCSIDGKICMDSDEVHINVEQVVDYCWDYKVRRKR